MKIRETIDLNRNISENLREEILQGRWYHSYRVCVIKDKNDRLMIASLNIFERALSHFLNLLNSICNFKTMKIIELNDVKFIPSAIIRNNNSNEPIIVEKPIDEKTFFENQVKENKEIFLKYQEKQLKKQLPVDMVIARGRVENSEYPALCSTRRLLREENEEDVPYSPLCVDIDEEEQPDIQMDITNVFHMGCFPDNSFDDIFMERIYPASPQLDFRTYYNIARILKVGGTFIMDVSSLCEVNQIQSVKEKFLEFFIKHDVPFMAYSLDSCRNALHAENKPTLAFFKHQEFSLKWTKDKKSKDKENIEKAIIEIRKIRQFIQKTKIDFFRN